MEKNAVRIRWFPHGYDITIPLSEDAIKFSGNGKESRTVGCINLTDVLQLVCDEIGDRNRWEVKLVEKVGH